MIKHAVFAAAMLAVGAVEANSEYYNLYRSGALYDVIVDTCRHTADVGPKNHYKLEASIKTMALYIGRTEAIKVSTAARGKFMRMMPDISEDYGYMSCLDPSNELRREFEVDFGWPIMGSYTPEEYEMIQNGATYEQVAATRK